MSECGEKMFPVAGGGWVFCNLESGHDGQHGYRCMLPAPAPWPRPITAKDLYDALADQLVGSCHYLGTGLDSGDLTSVTVDGEVDCVAMAEFLKCRKL